MNNGHPLETENRTLRRAILLLHRISTLVRSAVELEPTYYALLTGVTAGVGLGLNRAFLFLRDETSRGGLRGVAAVGPATAQEADLVWRSIEADSPDLETLHEAGLHLLEARGALDERVRAMRVDAAGGSPVALAMQRGRVVAREGDDDLMGLLDLSTAIAAPMRIRRTTRGVLYGDSCFTGRALAPAEQLVFALVADQAGHAMEAAEWYEQLAHDARTDALTGLGHHGTLMEALSARVDEARRSAQPLGLVMIDLDDFKKVNDTHGHLAGDALLAAVSKRILDVVRNDERPYRYGGEEFAILLPGARRETAAAVGERVCEAFRDRPFPVSAGVSLQVTCSVGVASMPEDASEGSGLIAAADGALLAAKAQGKNRVICAKG